MLERQEGNTGGGDWGDLICIHAMQMYLTNGMSEWLMTPRRRQTMP